MAKERFSSIDSIMLRVEAPIHPNMGTGVLTLGGKVSLEQLRYLVEDRLLRFDRFRQRVVYPRTPLRSYYWEDDPDFDLGYHLRRANLPPPGDEAALRELVSLLAGTPLDLERPLWQVHWVPDYGAGCAIICRIHHSLADGVALMHVILSLAQRDPGEHDEPAPRIQGDRGAPPERKPRRVRLASARRTAGRLARQGLDLAANPEDAAQMARQAVEAVGDLVLVPPDYDSALRGRPSEAKGVAWSKVALADVKTIGRRMGGTVNDILLTAMSGALRRYLAGRGESLDSSGVHALVPISLRPEGAEEDLGNRIGVVLLPLPVEVAEPADRLREIRRRMDEYKGSMEAPIVYEAMNRLGRVPTRLIGTAVDYLCARATAIVTNVKGPQERLYLAGAPLEEFMFWTPRFGGIGIGISILSYAGEVQIGVISDRDTVPDPETVTDGFCAEFKDLLALALEQPASVRDLSDLLDSSLMELDQLLAEDAEENEPA